MMSPTSRLLTVPVDGRPVGCHVLDPAPASVHSPPLRLPVILLHGLGCSSEAWWPTLDTLAERCLPVPVFVPDMPGFGCSPGPPEALGMANLADWTVRLMDTLGLTRAHLAGNSMGCQVALALARRCPERVGGLVLVGPTVGEQYVSFWRYALGLLLDGVQEPPVYNLRLARMYAQMGVPRFLATTRKMLEDEPLRHADEVRAPCLIVRGERDGIIPRPGRPSPGRRPASGRVPASVRGGPRLAVQPPPRVRRDRPAVLGAGGGRASLAAHFATFRAAACLKQQDEDKPPALPSRPCPLTRR